MKSLVVPAADEAESIWKKRFGLEKLTQNEVRELLEKEIYFLFFFFGVKKGGAKRPRHRTH